MEAWMETWQDMQALVGQDLRAETLWGADRIEAGAVRRYLEPLEFDCALHDDASAARRHGHPDCIVPYTSLWAFAFPALREPGESLFTRAGRNDQPLLPTRAVTVNLIGVPPACSKRLVADMAMDYLRAVHVGERLGQRGRRVLSCRPKQTSIGRGAFVTYETDLVSDLGDVVARSRYCIYHYEPAAEP